jgi:hypothetical protein
MTEPRDEELSRIYGDAEGPGPSQRVEDNILAASQRVAGARPQPAGARFARRWGAPVAIAATVVVTSTLTLMVFERKSDLDAMAPATSRAVRPAKVSPAEPKRAEPPGTPSPAKLQPIAPAPAIPPAALRRDQARQRPGESAAPSRPLGTGQPAFVPEIPRTSEVLRKAEETKPVPATADAAAGAGVPAAGASRPGVSEAGERTTPERWLQDIRKLRTEGKAAEAERELDEFRKRYPDYRLPEDLQ